jgi:hypothetical protein
MTKTENASELHVIDAPLIQVVLNEVGQESYEAWLVLHLPEAGQYHSAFWSNSTARVLSTKAKGLRQKIEARDSQNCEVSFAIDATNGSYTLYTSPDGSCKCFTTTRT